MKMRTIIASKMDRQDGLTPRSVGERTNSRKRHVALAAMAAMLMLNSVPPAAAQQPPANFVVHPAPKQVPDFSFTDETRTGL